LRAHGRGASALLGSGLGRLENNGMGQGPIQICWLVANPYPGSAVPARNRIGSGAEGALGLERLPIVTDGARSLLNVDTKSPPNLSRG